MLDRRWKLQFLKIEIEIGWKNGATYLKLEWDGEESNDDIGQGQVRNEVVRHRLHATAGQNDANHQTVSCN